MDVKIGSQVDFFYKVYGTYRVFDGTVVLIKGVFFKKYLIIHKGYEFGLEKAKWISKRYIIKIN